MQKINVSGIMYLNSDGRKRILSPNENIFSLFTVELISFGCGFWFFSLFGRRNNIQNVAPSRNGMINIIINVKNGVQPSDSSAAYEKAPKIPAPPVPLDQ